MAAETSSIFRTPREVLRRIPWIVLVVVVPSWAFWLALDRDDGDLDHLLYFYMPDLIERPLRLIPNLTVTPWVNTQTDQIVLITVLVGVFGTLVERRIGFVRTFAVFWGTSALAAILGAALFHLLEPMFGDLRVIESGRERVFNGASAGGYGLMGAYAATTRWTRYWVIAFLIWEPTFWWLIAQAVEFTPTFHVIAFIAGALVVRLFFQERLTHWRERAIRPSSHRLSTGGP